MVREIQKTYKEVRYDLKIRAVYGIIFISKAQNISCCNNEIWTWFEGSEELAYYNKIREEIDDMKKDTVKKGIPLRWNK